MGWSKGKGLGKNEDGMEKPIQIKRREEGTGLGEVNLTPAATFKWADNFWDNAYNTAAKNFATVEVKPDRKLVESETSESEFSDFEIEKSRTPRLAPKKEETKKDKKSKKIKKDKKDKKDKKLKKSKRADSDSL